MASGCYRPVGFARHLGEFGYQCTVLSTTPESLHPVGLSDDSTSRLIPADITVERLAHPSPLRDLLRWRDRMTNSTSNQTAAPDTTETSAPAQPPKGLIRRWRTRLIDRMFVFPDHQQPWVNAVCRHVNSLPSSERPDVVLATGNPWSALVTGWKVGRQLNIPFIADYRDPWTANPYLVHTDELLPAAIELERKIVKSAARVVANTQELGQWFSETYPECASNVVTLTNGFLERAAAGSRENSKSSAKTELWHFGTVYELRKPLELFEAAENLLASGVMSKDNFVMRFTGPWSVTDPKVEPVAQRLEREGVLVREDTISQTDVHARMATAQHLLVLQQSFPLQIPGKIYEYIAIGRPIVVVGGQGATANLVSEHQLGKCVPNHVDDLSAFLEQLIQRKIELTAPGEETVQRFSYNSITRRLAQILDETLAETGSRTRVSTG